MAITPFATPTHVKARMGRATDYTGSDLAHVEILLELATGLILDAVDKTAAWAAALTEIPSVLRSVCVEAVVRVLINPGGVRSESEQLGAHQHSVSFKDGMGALELTDSEVHRVRRAVYGRLSGSAVMRSMWDDLVDPLGS